MIKFKILILLVIFLFCKGSFLSAQEPLLIKDLESASYYKAVFTGTLKNKKLVEASGIASSRIHNDVLWILNDSGNKAKIFAVGTDGSDHGVYNVEGSKNRDWEDMASFVLNNTSYLLIADVGDNNDEHNTSTLYFVKEPDIEKNSDKNERSIPVVWSLCFRYEDGPRDCEAVAVDVVRKKIYLLSKRNVPPVLYELLLNFNSSGTEHIARRVTVLSSFSQPLLEENKRDGKIDRKSVQPTSMDISADGQLAVVLTLKNIFLYEFKTDWYNTFAVLPKYIKLPKLPQSEAVCFGIDGRTLFITSEKRYAPLYRIEKK